MGVELGSRFYFESQGSWNLVLKQLFEGPELGQQMDRFLTGLGIAPS